MTENQHSTLDLQPHHHKQIQSLLSRFVPDCEVWAFGSRVKGSSHQGSDLDLVLRNPNLNQIGDVQFAALAGALNDSELPFLVEIHDWARLPEAFRCQIEANYVQLTPAASKARSVNTFAK